MQDKARTEDGNGCFGARAQRRRLWSRSWGNWEKVPTLVAKESVFAYRANLAGRGSALKMSFSDTLNPSIGTAEL